MSQAIRIPDGLFVFFVDFVYNLYEVFLCAFISRITSDTGSP